MALWVYILVCSDSTYYTGISNNPEMRFLQHQNGINKEAYTYSRRPVKLVYAESFTDYKLAYSWEKRIKKWSSKKKKALIEDNWEELQKLSICRNETHHSNVNKTLESVEKKVDKNCK